MEEVRMVESEVANVGQPVNLPVYLRIKPLGGSGEASLKVIDDATVETNHDGRANKKATFTRVFQGHVGQQQVFDCTTASLLQRFLDGANVMTFAYGVTSSGKTYTIMGNHSNPGLVPRTLERIFGHYQSKIATSMLTYKPVLFEGAQQLKANEVSELRRMKTSLLCKMKSRGPGFAHYTFKSRTEDQGTGSDLHATIVSPANFCTVWISVYEIYNEIITDLLLSDCNRSKRKPLTIGQDAKGRTFVKDLTQLPVNSAAEAYTLLQVAKQNLAKASTKLNDNSSRSHMVFNIRMVHWGGSCIEPLVNHFVISDLAGSERQAKTGTSGATLKQASAINNSLLVLGRCLEALRKRDRGISAPFRDSKLTRILNPFFTLGGFVSLIICINPDMSLKDETLDTIRFSAIASEIVQETIRPSDRLRKLRRLTQTCAVEPDAVRSGETDADSDLVESWKDAVGLATVRKGTRYLEIKASYFNDMARDILYAEKQLMANEEEIESLKCRLRAAETSKENIHSMYQDRMKEQRDKFLTLKSDLKEFYENEKASIVSSLNEEIDNYEQKYSKYRNGYAKVSSYLEEKVWPELSMFRELFGYLPAFPCLENGDGEEPKPENTLRYWQEKVEQVEGENQCLRNEMSYKQKQLTEMSEACANWRNVIADLRSGETISTNERHMEMRVKELENKLESMKQRCDDAEALENQVSTLREQLCIAERARENLLTEHEANLDNLREQMSEIVLRQRETDSKDSSRVSEAEDSEQGSTVIRKLSGSSLPEDTPVLPQNMGDLIQNLARLLTLIPGSNGMTENVDETTLAAQRFGKLGIHDGVETGETSSSVTLESQFATLRDCCAKLSEVILSRAPKPAPVVERLEEVDPVSDERTRSEEGTILLQDSNVQLRERLQEFQDALEEKETVITAQASELEELKQRTVESEVFKTKAETLEAENKELRKRIRSIRLAEMSRLQDRTLIENRTLPLFEGSVGALSSGTDSSAIGESSDKTASEESTPRKSKQRRRLRLSNDENCVLDRTLKDSIQDATPCRDFRAIQRKR